MAINISNAKNRDATVALEAVKTRRDVRYIDEDHNMVMTRRLLKTDVVHDLAELTKKSDDLGKLAKKLVKDDPEVDIEHFGMFLGETSRVYVSDKGIVHSVEEFEVIKNPDGTVRDRRPRKKELQNVNSDIPLKWTGKFIKKKEAVKKFVFASKKQLVHVNGLTYDFLFEIAKELHDRDSLMLMRGGEKGDKPLVLNRGGKPYNAFLEGRVDGDAYLLILHLSNMELKKPKPIEIPDGGEEE
jgi:ribosomal protein S24E